MHAETESVKYYHYVVQLNSCLLFTLPLTSPFLEERQTPLQGFMQDGGLFVFFSLETAFLLPLFGFQYFSVFF